MAKLLLHSLACVKTEDLTHADNCRLEVRLDGALQPVKKKKLDKGQTWPLGLAYDFSGAAEIRLFDEDWPDADDNLGSIAVSATAFPNASGVFDRDGAQYILHYSIEAPEVGPVTPENLVEEALAEFETSGLPGAWANLDKAVVLSEMRARIAEPFRVDQRDTPFCGPASIVFELVRRQPRRYVQICKSLFEAGRFPGRYRTFSASDRLRALPLRTGMAQVDWMLLSTLREAENIFLDVGAEPSPIEGMTTPWEMCGWIYEILGYDESNYDSTWLWGEMRALETAREVWNNNGVVFFMISADLLNRNRADDEPVAYSDHWIVFNGALSVTQRPHKWYEWDTRQVTFSIYTWGRIRTIDVSEGLFEDNMFGIVAGHTPRERRVAFDPNDRLRGGVGQGGWRGLPGHVVLGGPLVTDGGPVLRDN